MTPVTTWVQPESLNTSLPPIPNEFSRFTHLTRGIGFDEESGNFFGPLTPFPQQAVQTFDVSACGSANDTNPIAVINAAISVNGGLTSSTSDRLFVRSGDAFVLSGSQARPNISDDSLTYKWALVEDASTGGAGNLSNVQLGTKNQTYTASFPSTAPVGDYVFELVVESTVKNVTISGSTNVTISLFNGLDTVTVNAVTWTSTQSGTVGVVCSSNYLVDTAVGMTVQVTLDKGSGIQIMSPTPPFSGRWAFSARSAPQPGTVLCLSRLGGFATQVGVTQ